MNEPTIAGTTMQPEPELHKKALDPKGVLQKNMKPVMYLGAAALVILAAVFSAHTKPTSAQHAATQHQPPQPTVQDSTDNNILHGARISRIHSITRSAPWMSLRPGSGSLMAFH